MKATRREHGFVPVILTLETQAEVDAIFSVMNHTTLAEVIGMPPLNWEVLSRYRDAHKCAEIHHAIVKFFEN